MGSAHKTMLGGTQTISYPLLPGHLVSSPASLAARDGHTISFGQQDIEENY